MSRNQEDLKRLQRLKADLHNRMPLIGGWLRHEAARTLVEDGSPEAISALTETLIRGNDPKVHGIALKALLKWAGAGKPEAQDALCRLVIERDESVVREIVLAAHYTPRDLSQRALFYLLTEQWEKYEQLDFDQHLLKTAYQGLDPTVRKRIAECVRRAGHVEWITFIAGERQKKRLSDMTEEEWEVALAMLRENQNWDEAWQLAQVAPVVWSARLLQQLKEAEWIPKQEVVRTVFTRLVRLAESCNKEGAEILTTSMECYATLEGNSRNLEALTISPDGQMLVSCKEKTVRVWSLPDGTMLKTLKGSKERITCLAISPDSRLLASSGWRLLDKGQFWIQVWNLLDGTVRHTLKGHTQKITCLAMSPDGQRLVSGSEDKTVCVWNVSDGQLLQTLVGWSTSLSIMGQTTNHNGRLLAKRAETGSNTMGSSRDVWFLPDEVRLPPLEGFSTLSWCLALSPDERIVATNRTALFNRSGGRDRIVRLWNLSDGSILHNLDGHTNAITSLAFSPDGNLLVSGGYDKTIRLWSLPGGELLHTLNVQQSHPTCLVVSPDGRLLASGNHNGTIQLWTLGLAASKHLFFRLTGLEDIKLAENILQAGRTTVLERKWLEFALELTRWQRRFDVELSEAPKDIPAGKFDIEIGSGSR
jgi:WD40 repeat protein